MDIDRLSDEELKNIIFKKQLEWIKLVQDNFLIFAQTVWEDFIYRKTDNPKKYGHHQIIAHAFEDIAANKEKRLIINMPPRHTKSEFASYLFPAWMIGKLTEFGQMGFCSMPVYNTMETTPTLWISNSMVGRRPMDFWRGVLMLVLLGKNAKLTSGNPDL